MCYICKLLRNTRICFLKQYFARFLFKNHHAIKLYRLNLKHTYKITGITLYPCPQNRKYTITSLTLIFQQIHGRVIFRSAMRPS